MRALRPVFTTSVQFASRRTYFSPTLQCLGKIVPFKLADIGEGLYQVELTQWYVKQGAEVMEFDKLCETHSDKAKYTITTPYDGKVVALHAKEGTKVTIGQVLCDIEVTDDVETETPTAKETAKESKQQQQSSPTPVSQTQFQTPSTSVATFATPAVRRIAKENDIDLKKVKGSGKNGRIMKGDVLDFLEKGAVPEAVGSSLTQREDKVFPIRGIQKAMVQSMKKALEIPAFGAMDEIIMNQLQILRDSLRHDVQLRNKSLKLSYMPFFVKAASLALNEFPMINAHTNDDCTEVIWKGSHNICFAMDTPSGLLVPNIKNVQDQSIFEIAVELDRLIQLGKTGSLTAANLQGGTFTLSNIGSIGCTYASPVIFPPQVAIGAIGRTMKVPRYNEKNELYPATIVNVSWSADHRVVDGATMVRFGNRFKDYIENPSRMLLDTK